MSTNISFFNTSRSIDPSAAGFLKLRGLGKCLIMMALGLLLCGFNAFGREFSLLVYNVENLFDADGIARFDQYKEDQKEVEFRYTPRKVLTKIRNIHQILSQVNDGAGPEVVLFQEIELDRSPESMVADYGEFLKEFADSTVEDMLGANFNEAIAGLPAEALLLKYLEDNRLGGYAVIKPEPSVPLEERTAQNNVVFSKLPIQYAKFHPLERARDIIEVGLSVEGHPLIIFGNHWKSGASNPETEPLRIQNAGVLRKRLDVLLAENPSADIVLGGDFNSYYNQKARNPEMKQTALNDVLRSREDEKALIEDDEVDLYNLWLELPAEKRGSEVYRGLWGTLMQVLVTPGLYDFNGVQYVDNSFFVLSVPGLNAGEAFGSPRRWYFYGPEGGGFSDHFPVGARFRTVEKKDDGADRFLTLDNPGKPDGITDLPPKVDYGDLPESAVRNAEEELTGLSKAELGERFGRVFRVDAELTVAQGKAWVEIGGRYFAVGSFSNEVRTALGAMKNGDIVHFLGELGEYQGKLNFLLRDESWLKN